MLTSTSTKVILDALLYLLSEIVDMVHILDAKVTRRYGEFFIRNINKFEEIIKDISGRWMDLSRVSI